MSLIQNRNGGEMNAFGWGIVLGSFSAVTVLAFYHKGFVTTAALIALGWAIILTAIPNHWVGIKTNKQGG